ncbi:MAG: AmmeMemoRadiSam system protein A [Desulfobacterales bacterium]|nr:AmmeMemoRadiSam system protein A [Desulfobacterales bacterium]
MTINLTDKEGKTLLNMARTYISNKFDHNSKDSNPPKKNVAIENNIFYKKRGVFVTLHKDGCLRGCIGTLEPVKSIVDGIKDNSLNAAFQDPRFSPLKLNELNEINIEVSILTKPKKLEYTNSKDLLSKLKPNIHGVIIKYNKHKATFLPQVWDQLPDTKDFLSHICQKAGLVSDEWEKGKLEVLTYKVQYFKEK